MKIIKEFAVEYNQIVPVTMEIYILEKDNVWWLVNTRNSIGTMKIIPQNEVGLEVFEADKQGLIKALHDSEVIFIITKDK